MPGTMRKLGLYLGLVEDDEHEQYGYDEDEDAYEEPSVRRYPPTASTSSASTSTAATRRSFDTRSTAGAVALDPVPRPHAVPSHDGAHDAGYRITTLHPHSYNDARAIGEHFRSGTPVIMNLSEMDDADAKRLVDFAAGLIFGLHGRIERVTNKVFLLSPEHVEVTAEDKARIAEAGFFNQS
ncbi:MAG: cell division protein SepF [Frankiales bacterium]|jgi:cell division inhibitor SepF|nr:cell division protein SepF [Frankiales bacterium]